ncbi:hypothetical protein OJF2_38900 [Aquisphaera giovannonii]|uniref:Uncharacterized protein n=1 Tax=Aquisphaera giovannonii TaxID=406548 RepID=A0A5B9W5D1_9BACT|nr:hypothetical protein [Aquisphaera giovannonii]QEH35339.1 hypothetical protein OJF2_38900 [Aquisphaera giovannonii]
MKNRRNTLLWMKDLIEHMSRCHDQLQWASDGEMRQYLAEAMLGDLQECQRLCEELRAEPRESDHAARASRRGSSAAAPRFAMS